jgi:hypothetical protein
MAKSRRKRSTRSKKKGRSKGGTYLFLLLFLLAGCVVFWQRGAMVTGLQLHLAGGGETAALIGDMGDLARAEKRLSGRVRVQGIPDYESRFRFPSRDGLLTCFRMTGFEDRLFVCTDKPLKVPDGIEDVIKKRAYIGFMEPLHRSRFRETLNRGFQREHGIRPALEARLVLAGGMPGPSLLKTVLLAGCALLCFFFLLKLIQSLKA